MASYEDKQTKKYMEYYYAIYVGIGCILGTLCHALFTFRWGDSTLHYVFLWCTCDYIRTYPNVST